jgi:hypothetical protein
MAAEIHRRGGRRHDRLDRARATMVAAIRMMRRRERHRLADLGNDRGNHQRLLSSPQQRIAERFLEGFPKRLRIVLGRHHHFFGLLSGICG